MVNAFFAHAFFNALLTSPCSSKNKWDFIPGFDVNCNGHHLVDSTLAPFSHVINHLLTTRTLLFMEILAPHGKSRVCQYRAA